MCEKIKLWIAFLPLSPLVMLAYVLFKWHKLGLGGINRINSKLTFTMVVCVFIIQIPLGLILCWLAVEIQAAIFTILYAYIYCVIIALAIREIEHWLLKKAIDNYGD